MFSEMPVKTRIDQQTYPEKHVVYETGRGMSPRVTGDHQIYLRKHGVFGVYEDSPTEINRIMMLGAVDP